MSILSVQFDLIERLFMSCEIDYLDIKKNTLSSTFFDEHQNLRLINSFLFGFSKIQDKIGAKLFKKVLFELKELDDDSVPMRDVLNTLEKLKIIQNTEDWERIREIRNLLTHEYPLDSEERIENIEQCLFAYDILKAIFIHLKEYCLKQKLIEAS
jgi:hypothetical protein